MKRREIEAMTAPLIGGALLIGAGVGLILDEPGAGTLIGLGAGLVLRTLFTLPFKIMKWEKDGKI